MLSEYTWFLESLNEDKDSVLRWIGDKNKRVEAFSHSDRYTDAMYSIIKRIAEDNGYLRYLVI